MKTKIKVILAFVTIFCLGGISGYLLNDSLTRADRNATHEKFDRNSRWEKRSDNTGEERDRRRKRMIEKAQSHLTEELDLTEAQKDPFFDLLHNYHTEIRDSVQSLKSIENKFIREHYHDFRDEISGLLNEGQVEKLDNFFHPDSVRHKRMQYNRR